MGGLGNQMFQYAFARSLALRNGTSLRLSRYYFRDDYFKRSYALNNLSLPDEVGLMTSTSEFFTKKLFNLLRLFAEDKDNFYNDRVIVLDDSNRYEPEFMRVGFVRNNIIVRGYFQAWRYFADFDEQIKRELRVSTPPSKDNAAMMKELASCESVCVHVRRGDYLSLGWSSVCDYEYYRRAIEYIAEKVHDPVFYFFSNDHTEIEWLKNNWSFDGFNVKYVDLDNPDYEELRLMYSCKHFIVANSSFSWWGSYLSDNPGKIVCVPSRWVDERPTREMNLLMPDWKII